MKRIFILLIIFAFICARLYHLHPLILTFNTLVCQLRHLRSCLPDQISRSDPDLQTPLSGTDINVIELSGGVVDIGRKMLFHADGGAAATDVAGEGEEFFDRDHFTAFVAGDFSGLFQINLVGAGNYTDEVAAFVAVEDKRLEYLRDILA